jgi:hypothetical protein
MIDAESGTRMAWKPCYAEEGAEDPKNCQRRIEAALYVAASCILKSVRMTMPS